LQGTQRRPEVGSTLQHRLGEAPVGHGPIISRMRCLR
jgi:hypothetical protein